VNLLMKSANKYIPYLFILLNRYLLMSCNSGDPDVMVDGYMFFPPRWEEDEPQLLKTSHLEVGCHHCYNSEVRYYISECNKLIGVDSL